MMLKKLFVLNITLTLFLFGSGVYAQNYTVNNAGDQPDNNPGDGVCQTALGGCTLRAALDEANNDIWINNVIDFSLASGTVIVINQELLVADIATTISADFGNDGIPDIIIESGGTNIIGFHITGSNNIIQGFNMVNFIGTGTNAPIVINGGSGNDILSNYIGTNLAGNDVGVGFTNFRSLRIINGASNNNIGDGTLIGRNIISGNTFGIEINGSDNNKILGNIIGLDALGNFDYGNNSLGINVVGSSGTFIGAAGDGRNYIAGNGGSAGIAVNNSPNTTIINNIIGTNLAGDAALRNDGDGINVSGTSTGTMIGTGIVGEGNLISGNGNQGIEISSANVTVLGNSIGLGADGMTAIPNTSYGIWLATGANNIIVGNSTPDGRNTISGNNTHGIQVSDGANLIQGNYIGTRTNGNQVAGNGGIGISVTGGSGTTLGGTLAGEGNVIAGNAAGIEVSAGAHFIYGNTIGLNEARTLIRANNEGIRLTGTAQGVQIGDGTTAGANFISGNTTDGILLSGSSVTNNLIQLNYVGVEGDLTTPAGNGADGINLNSDASSNPVTHNIIANNGSDGIEVNGFSTLNNVFVANSIYNNTGKGINHVSLFANAPIVTGLAVDGTISGTCSVSATLIDIFIDSADEGQVYLTSLPPVGGVWSYSADLQNDFPAGQLNITATQLDLGYTSEFSPPYDYSVTFDPFIVTNTNDSGVGSLRWCIENANASATAETISFNIPGVGPWVISPTTALPAITMNGVIIDGSTQPGWNIDLGDMPTLDGSGLSGTEDGLVINGTDVEVYGLQISTFPNRGIGTNVFAANAIIGDIARGNVINGNTNAGVAIGWVGSVVAGNRIGTNAQGTVANGNGTGVVSQNGTIIRDNLISGNTTTGIFINSVSSITIQDNIIGANITGTSAIPNDVGISLNTTSNNSVLDNVISGNTSSGIQLSLASSTIIQGNNIGTGSNGTDPIGNGIGIYFWANGMNSNLVGGTGAGEANIIANNINQGILLNVSVVVETEIIANSIYANGAKGIDLNGVANNNKSAPVITTYGTGSVSGTGVDGDIIHVYRDNTLNSPLQGQEYLGTTTVTGGVWTYSEGSILSTDLLNATATDAVGNTSEFAINYAEIMVFDGADNTGMQIFDAQVTDVNLGIRDQGTDLDYLLTVDNKSSAALTINSITVTGTDFSIIGAPATIPANSSDQFTVHLSGTNIGVFSETITIDSDDEDEGIFTFPITGEIVTSTAFITTWQTNDTEITIPTFGGESYLYDVTWTNLTNAGVGDGAKTNLIGNYTITGLANGDVYQVAITGAFPRIYFNNGSEKDKILTVEQWGTNLWTSMANAFYGCSNLTIIATDAPYLLNAIDLTQMFRGASSITADLSSWDVSNIELFIGMFRDATSFNGDITSWDVTSATDMTRMFFFASSFNQPIGGWHPDNVLSMASMFAGATAFNQPVNTVAATGAWTTTSVLNMDQMFSSATSFNQPLDNWNVSNVTLMRSMFSNASAFNQDISGWNIGGLSSLQSFFRNATAFNQPLPWDVAGISRFDDIFNGATAFNQVLSWDMSGAVSVRNMFANTTYNQDITTWQVFTIQDFNGMFENNPAFNQDISGWLTTAANDMRNMFDGASAFNQNLGGWNLSNIFSNDLINMLNNSGLSIENYDNTLIGWQAQTPNSGVNLGAVGLRYCAGESARAALIANGWSITDAGSGCISVFDGLDNTAPVIVNLQPLPIDVGSTDITTPKIHQVTIENNLITSLTNFDISITGSAFTVTNPAALPVTISPSIPLTIDIQLSDPTGGSFTETVTLSSTDMPSDFVFTITGVVTAVPEPEIKVFAGSLPTGLDIPDGAVSGYYLGQDFRGSDVVNQFTILNNGSAPLVVSSLSVSGTGFSVSPNTAFTVPVNGNQIINVVLDGTLAGYFSETVNINSNDSDENPFDFVVEGEILGPKIRIFDGPDRFSYPEVMTGQDLVDLGSAIQGTDITKKLTIANFGPVDLDISKISISGSGFTITPAAPVLINAEFDAIITTVVFDLTLSGATPGSFTETVTITSDDDTTPIFNFDVSGKIAGINDPKLYWTELNGFEINRSALDGSIIEQYHAEPTYEPRGIAIDTLNNIVYWTNSWGQIKKGVIGPAGFTSVVDFLNDGIDLPREMNGLALDVPGDKIYWTSTYDGSIKSADLSSPDPFNVTTTAIITGADSLLSVAVDPGNGKLYYTSNFNNNGADDNIAELHEVNLDGTNDIILATEQISGEQFTYRDVKLNLAKQKIYWTSGGEDEFNPIGLIYSASLADVSGTTTSFTTYNENPVGIDLDLTNGKIYWIDKFIYMEPHLIMRANLDGSVQEQVISPGDPILGRPLFLALDIAQPIAGCVNPPTANAGLDQTICESDAVTLTAVIGGDATTQLWTTSGDGSFDDNTSITAIYTPGSNDIAGGTVTLTITTNDPDLTGPCKAAIDDMILTIDKAHMVDAGPDQTICPNEVVNLTGTLGGSANSAIWITNGDGTFDDNTLLSAAYTPGASDLASGIVSLTLTSVAGVACNDVADAIIVSINQPITVTNQMASLDVAETATIDVTIGGTFNSGDNLTTTLLTQPVKGTATVNLDGTIAYTSSAGTVGADSFDFEVCNQCGLCGSATVDLSINNVPPTTSVPSASIDAGGVLSINVLDNLIDENGNVDLSSLRIIVQPLSGAVATLDVNGLLTVDYSGVKFAGTDELTIEICDQLGLCSQFIVTIEVAPSKILVFNAVSPNGDGKNDFLEIEGAEFFQDNKIKIMNRWGDIVFEATGYNNQSIRFEGKANTGGNGELPAGTYYYLFSLGDGTEDINGFFSLRR